MNSSSLNNALQMSVEAFNIAVSLQRQTLFSKKCDGKCEVKGQISGLATEQKHQSWGGGFSVLLKGTPEPGPFG